MLPLSRRSFFAAGFAGVATSPAFAQTTPTTPSVEDFAFHPNTLFLTWHRDPTTTMDVVWIGAAGESAETKVYFRPVSLSLSGPMAVAVGPAAALSPGVWKTQESTAKPYPKTDLKVFRAELTGLEPGRMYDLRIGKSSPTYRFQTMPAKANDTIHFVTGGDCGVNSHAVANNIQAARQDPMFAVVGGDLGYDNGRSVEISLAFIRNYSKHMVGRNGRLIPLLAGIGNHEVDGGYGKTREKAPFFYSLFGDLYPNEGGYATLDFGEYLSLIFLDTGHTATIDGDQTEWLEKQLKARKDHPNVMVVNHVPAYPSYRKMDGKGTTGTGALNRKHWVPLFEKFRVPVVLEHHDHTFKRSKPLIEGTPNADGVLYLGDGSWGRLRPPQAPEKLPHLARMSQEYHLSLHRIQGEDRFHLALDEFGRVMDVAQTGQRGTGQVQAGE